jgi:hypothetical protein
MALIDAGRRYQKDVESFRLQGYTHGTQGGHMKKLTAALLVSVLPACGGGGGSPGGTTPVTQPPVARASITMAQTTVGQICISPVPNKVLRIKLPMRITESAGLGFNINAIRLSLFLGATETERAEMTANAIIAIRGSNHVNARGVVDITLSHDLNASVGSYDSIRYLAQFTDDRGNDINLDVLPPFSVVQVPFCSI